MSPLLFLSSLTFPCPPLSTVHLSLSLWHQSTPASLALPQIRPPLGLFADNPAESTANAVLQLIAATPHLVDVLDHHHAHGDCSAYYLHAQLTVLGSACTPFIVADTLDVMGWAEEPFVAEEFTRHCATAFDCECSMRCFPATTAKQGSTSNGLCHLRLPLM